ncbi:MAG: putative colanic acid biosynthesis acetyltransferase [Candidatus Ozemobacteraceae bacterium]
MKDHSCLGENVTCYSMAQISLGERSVVSQGTHLCCGSHDYEHPDNPLFSKPISVGDYAWVAAEAFIGPGVSIGKGAVVGARSLVVKDIPDWSVCGGNPCQFIKPRKLRLP